MNYSFQIILVTVTMADDFDVEAMLEAPYRKEVRYTDIYNDYAHFYKEFYWETK